MSGAIWSFAVGDHPEVTAVVLSTDVHLVEGDEGSIIVEIDGREQDVELFEVAQDGDIVTVRSTKRSRRWIRRGVVVRLTVPSAASVSIRSASGGVRSSVPLADARIHVASGDIRLASLNGRGRIKSASGDIVIGAASGDLGISSASGDVRIDEIDGEATISTASGDVEFGSVRGSLEIKTASGDVTIRRFSGASLEASAMSGDFDLGLVPGMTIDADIQTRSGTFRNRLSPGSGERTLRAALSIKTMSGDITLR